MEAFDGSDRPVAHYVLWCKQMFAMLSDGGIWGIPRSGLVFRKTEHPPTLTLIERMPHDPAMPISAKELSAYQDEDYGYNKRHFEAAGVTVTREDDPR